MLPVSTRWQKATREQFRYQAYLSVSLEVAPPGTRLNTVISTTDTFKQSTTDDMLFMTDTPVTYATLEPNRWRLDGTCNILPPGATTGNWWSKNAVGAPVTLTFTFDKEYTIPGLFITWDSIRESYPTNLQITGYNLQGGIIKSGTVTNIDSYEGFISGFAMENVKKVVLVIREWSVPGWRARIENVIFGIKVDFYSRNNGRISGATQVKKASPTGAELPTDTFQVTMRNTDHTFDPDLQTGISPFLARQQIMYAKWQFYTEKGRLESAPLQKYLVDSFEIPKDSKDVTLNATTRLALLDNKFTRGNYTGTNRTVAELVDYILSNSSILKERPDQRPWVYPASFTKLYSSAPIPAMSVNALMQLLGQLSGAWLTTRATDGFVYFAYPDSSAGDDCAIEVAQEFGDPTIKVEDRLKSVTVGIYNYSVDSETKEVGKGEYVIAGKKKITVNYSSTFADNVYASVTGATLLDVKYFASYAEVSIDTGDPVNATEVTISLTGNEIVQSISYLDTYDDPLVTDGKRITVENPFVTSVDMAQLVSDTMLRYYLKRTKYTLDYQGYPQLEPRDGIHQTTVFGSSDVNVMSNTIQFNGGWTGTAETL